MIVLLTALGVGGATIIGALLGFIIKKPSQRFNDIIYVLVLNLRKLTPCTVI